jgi:predicted transcriptional regulator
LSMADKNVFRYGRKRGRREQIAWLHFHERKTITEIAEELGVTKQAVSKALKPERAKLSQETALIYKLNHEKLLELVSDIYHKAIKAYAISQSVIKEDTVEDQSGKKLKVYVCDQNAELSGDPRFLEVALRSIDRLIVLYEGKVTVSMMKQASSENSFWNKAKKVLEEYIQETNQVQVSYSVEQVTSNQSAQTQDNQNHASNS